MTTELALYKPLFHGTAADLEVGDFLVPPKVARNVAGKRAIFATRYFPKAAAIALLAKHNMQNITPDGKWTYSYVFSEENNSLILYPGWNWDDDKPVFVYHLYRADFYFHPKSNEAISRRPVKIYGKEVLDKQYLIRDKVKLFVAKNNYLLLDLVNIDQKNSSLMTMRLINQCADRIL